MFSFENIFKIRDSITRDDIKLLVNNKDNITLFNIEGTIRCNNKCTYCHVYERKYTRSEGIDISDDLFEIYMKFIGEFASQVRSTVQWRISGGDPIVLGDRLFELANKGADISGVNPYVLTAGRGITEDRVLKGRDSALQNAFISVENPLDPDKGANKPQNVIESIQKYNHKDFQLLLGVCIIKNDYFGNIVEICDHFYERTGQIPTIHELNYGKFEKPSQQQLEILEDQLDKVLDKYKDKILLRLFPSVFPEMSFGGKMVFLSDLPVVDKYNFSEISFDEKLDLMSRRFLGYSYPKYECPNPCDLNEFCKNIKRFWRFDTDGKYNEDRLQTYCKFKQMLSRLYMNHFADIAVTQ